MRFNINPAIFDQFPEVLLGVVVAKNINNIGEHPEIQVLLKQEESTISSKIGDIPVAEHPNIVSWREIYRKFDAKPKDYPSSIENLTRRILKGETVRHINKLVDLYNIISLRHLVPVGGEDLSKIVGDIELTFATDHEQSIHLLGEKEPRAPHTGEVIYKDDNGAICRRWNWKEADRTKLTEETKNCILVIEALPPIQREKLQHITQELAEFVQKYCGAETSTQIMDAQRNQLSLE